MKKITNDRHESARCFALFMIGSSMMYGWPVDFIPAQIGSWPLFPVWMVGLVLIFCFLLFRNHSFFSYDRAMHLSGWDKLVRWCVMALLFFGLILLVLLPMLHFAALFDVRGKWANIFFHVGVLFYSTWLITSLTEYAFDSERYRFAKERRRYYQSTSKAKDLARIEQARQEYGLDTAAAIEKIVQTEVIANGNEEMSVNALLRARAKVRVR